MDAGAQRLSTTTGVDPQALYGMLRAGLPTEPTQLARVSRVGVGKALEKAAEAGIVALTPAQVSAAQDAFDTFAHKARRALVGPGTLSSYGEMLTAAGLSNEQQRRFDAIYTTHSGGIDELWQRVRQADLPADRLQLSARLGYLTLDNAPLVASLGVQVRSTERLAETLVNQRLYQPARWRERLKSLAGEDEQRLAKLIPPAYEGDTAEERLEAYADDLAQKVRRSYPTRVVGHLVRTGDLPLDGAVNGDVANVLDRAAARGFSLGRVALNRFLRDNADNLFRNLPEDRAAQAGSQVKTLHRLYQVTRSDEGLKALLEAGFRSAHEIATIPYEQFLERFGDRFPSRWEASLTWRKAQQVAVVTYSFLGAAKQVAIAPRVPAVAPRAELLAEARNTLIRQYPTLETLFGSLDFCECEHCRSVLSPAAYLVDILKFLDIDTPLWTSTLAAWRAEHDGATYPFPTERAWRDAGRPAPMSPFDVLTERRPDLPQTPLTCENTTTALPYIDIVNEILEYYVVHRALGPDAAHDTGGAATADLLAEPQHLLPGAYDTLRQARYPLTLPFDLWLETVRGFAAHFETPLWRVLGALGSTDEERAAVEHERLGVSADEVAILAAGAPLDTWRELFGIDPAQVTEAQALEQLSPVTPLARRLGIDYHELVALVRSAFVNPHLDTLGTLRALGVSTEDMLRYGNAPGHAPLDPADRAAFEAALGPEGVAWLTGVLERGELGRILVLADPVAGCGFETTTLRFADGSAADPMAFVLLNFLIRVWRRLGWPLEEVDHALRVFLPRDPDPRTGQALGPAMATALLGLADLVHLAELLGARRDARRELLSLWAPVDDRRFVELFLSGGEQTRDPVFEHPLGRYLSHLQGGRYRPFHFDPQQPEDPQTGNVGLANHLGAVQAAVGLTVDEIARILAAANTDTASAPLNLETVSLLHRHAVLARLLRLSVAEMLSLVALSGLDPFALPHTIRFVEVADAVRESRLSVDELNYLLRHRFEPVGPYRAAGRPPLELLRTLAAEAARIRAEHAVPADPLTFTDEVVVRKLQLVLEPAVADRFRAMWTGETPLDAAFFDEHLLRRMLPEVGEVGFLDAADAATLFTATPGDQAADRVRRARLAEAFLPYLQDRLIRALVVSSVAAAFGADPALAESLLTNPALLDDPGQPGAPLLSGYTRAARYGLTVTTPGTGAGRISGYLEVPASGAYRFFVGGASAGTRVELRLDHLGDPVLAATADDSGTEPTGHAELRAGVPYGFAFEHTGPGGDSAGAGEVSLLVQGQQLAKGPIQRLVEYPREGVEHLHRVHLLVAKTLRLADALALTEAELRHMLSHRDDFAGLDLGELPTRAGDDTPARARALFGQFLRLAGWVRLRGDLAAEPGDLVDLVAHARRRLPDGVDPGQAGENALVDVCTRLAAITRRDPAMVRAAADMLGIAAAVAGGDVTVADLTQERGIDRLWNVLALAARLGVDPATLRRWADSRPDHAVARDVRDAVKARYDTDQWRRVAQPIFDRLRQRRRDALVAHIMHTDGFARPEELFEHFLVDPGTEPVVETSRIRLAISSVQTFVQRCLLNLEPKVHPSALEAEHWAWMKRYRVWEANRKIFLWPENWLEPEFRDDKTHLFADLESALLESDLDDERAEAAFFGYLRGLEEVARLDVRAIHVEPNVDPHANVLHMVARTFGSPHRYFYRSYAYRVWTPWIPVTAEIEGDHVVIAVWRDRVHLFWVTFLENSVASAGSHGTTKATDMQVGQLMGLRPSVRVAAQLNWIGYFQGEWSAVATSGFRAPKQDHSLSTFDRGELIVHATLDEDGAVWIHLNGPIATTPSMAFRLVSPHALPTVEYPVYAPTPPFVTAEGSPGPGRYEYAAGAFSVRYVERVTTPSGPNTPTCPSIKPILRKGAGRTLVTHADLLPGLARDTSNLVSPFFLSDDRHTMFVEPMLTETTIEEGDRFILDPGRSPVDRRFDRADHWSEITVADRSAGTPVLEQPTGGSKFEVNVRPDMITGSGVLVTLGDRPIGPNGGVLAAEFAAEFATEFAADAAVRAREGRS